MSVLILDETTEAVVLLDDCGGDDGLHHFYCCDENRALCGADLSDVPLDLTVTEDSPDLCIVCRDLDFVPCERCGE